MKQRTNALGPIIRLVISSLLIIVVALTFTISADAASVPVTKTLSNSQLQAAAKATSATSTPNVKIKISKKNVTKKTYSVTKGKKVTLKITTTNLKGTKTIKYSSSNKKVATVTSKGVVKARSAGTAKIKVTVKAVSKKKTRRVTSWVKIKVVNKKDPAADQKEPASEGDSDASKTNILVAYFSCTGTTKAVAEHVADILGADLYEIIPEDPYTEADLDYYSGGRCDQEQDDPDVRPAISGKVENMSQYDTVLIGHPIWHGQAPRIISTFLESYDFSGKTLTTFCTSASSGLGSSAENLYGLVPDSAKWLASKRFAKGASRETVEEWLVSIGLK